MSTNQNESIFVEVDIESVRSATPVLTNPTPEILQTAAPTPQPTPIPTPTPPPTPNPDGLDAIHGSYTFAWISDTQNYFKRDRSDIFSQMVDFIVDNRERINIRYIIHTGDIVQDYDKTEQWDKASDIMDKLENIPHGVLAGNHDTGGKGDFSYYSKYFGQERFEGSSWFGGCTDENVAHYDVISAGDDRYVFVYLSYGAGSSEYRWAKEVFAEYTDHIGVLCLHDYFDTDMSMLDSGKRAYEKLVKPVPNLYLVLCGHRYNVGHRTDQIENEDGSLRTVHQVMMNYQAAGELGGSGYMMYIQVNNRRDELNFINYSPYTNDHRYFDNPDTSTEKYPMDPNTEEFTLPIPW